MNYLLHPVFWATIVLLLAWGAGFPSITVALESYSPIELATLRVSIAAFLLIMLACGLRRWGAPSLKDFLEMAACGICGLSLYAVLLGIGQQEVAPAEASFIVSLAPIFVVLLSMVFLQERIGWKTTFGIAISLTGTAVIAMSRNGGSLQFEWEALIVVLAASTQAFMTMLQKRLLGKGYSAFQITLYANIGAGLSLLPFGWPVFAKAASMPLADATLAILFLAVVSSVIGYLVWTYILNHMPASKAVSLMYLIPVSASFISWLWLGMAPGLMTLAGGGIVILGVAIVNIRRAQKAKQLPSTHS